MGTGEPHDARETGLPYLPGLDGLRGVAVVGVLLFHGGVAGFGGGFLGVSTFFTLSGFLITALLLGEQRRTGTIAFNAFWGRRFRRLLPAALVTICLASLLVWLAGDAEALRSFRTDGLAALGYVANWRFYVAGQSYAGLFATPSPLLHFWSLAIEEQFYLLFPLLAFAILHLFHGSRRAFGATIATLFTVSALLPTLLRWSDDRVYFGTDTRAAELLAGSLLAVILTSAPQPLDRLDRLFDERGRRVLDALGIIALGALVASWVVTSQTTRWVYTGGLPVYAALSAFVIFSAVLPGSPVRAFLAAAPLRALGMISYGVYLYHWPLLWWLTPARTGLATAPRLLLVAALTIAMATASYVFIEQPIRLRRRISTIPLATAAPAAGVLVAGLVLAVTISVPAPTIDLSAAEAGTLLATGPGPDTTAGPLDTTAPRPLAASPPASTDPEPVAAAVRTAAAPTAPIAAPPTTYPTLTPKPILRANRPLRVLVVGDSTAGFLDPPLNVWGTTHRVWGAAGYARLGCGLGRGGQRVNHAKAEPIPDDCGNWAADWAKELRDLKPDIVVIGSGLWDATDRQLPGETTWRRPGDPVYDEYLRKEFSLAADVAGSTGAVVAWLDNPPIKLGLTELDDFTGYSVNEPARMVRLNEIVADVAATRPRMRVIPYSAYLQGWPGGVFDRELRPDGVHVDGPGGAKVAEWLGPEILDAYWRVQTGT